MKIRTVQTSPYMVNTYLVTDEQTNKGFIVDPGGYDQKLADLIAEEGITISYIVLTHSHSDHTGGVAKFRELCPEARLVMSEAEKSFLDESDTIETNLETGEPILLVPDLLAKDGEVFAVEGMSFTVIITPGHTPGGLCLYGENVLFCGDTLFRASIGRTDFPGGSYPQIADSIHRKLFVLPDDTLVLPGHMGETTIGFEKVNNPFV